MQNTCSVVISAAGIGSRLGMNTPKCLVQINDKSIINHQLDVIPKDAEVIVVVGYKARDVINHVSELRKDVVYVTNHNYLQTGTAASLRAATRISKERIISLDGDLLITAHDFEKFFSSNENLLGITNAISENPVGIECDENNYLVTDMKYGLTVKYEWSGLMNLEKKMVNALGNGHVFEGLIQFLPLTYTQIDAFEIDTPKDLELAETWLNNKNG